MNRAKLLWNIEAYKKGRITDEQIVADVDAYSSALLQQHDVSGRSEQLPPSDAEIEDYFKSGYGGDAGSAIYGAMWMRKEILSGGNCH